jgi:uncharacterized membrane-anchored protein YhcB (DUF1043 family)
MEDNKKRIDTYTKEISAEFKDKALIKDIKHQIAELNSRIEKATAREPESKAPAINVKSEESELNHKRKKIRSRI